MTPFFLSIFPAFFRLGDLSKAISQWISKAERAKRWASERAAIKAEVAQAKETVEPCDGQGPFRSRRRRAPGPLLSLTMKQEAFAH